MEIATPERGGNLAVTIWYPTEAKGDAVPAGDAHGIFKGAPALKDAAPVKDRLPLVVVSHGSGGNVESMGWLGVELAKAGFVVAGPNHPGTTSGDSTPATTPRIWERTQDLSTVIDFLVTDAKWRQRIDARHIGVVGFSLGGATAMEIAGARADLEAYARYCDRYAKWDCAWFAGGRAYVDGALQKVDKFDLRSLDRTLFERSNLDPRVKSAVLVDPGLAQAYVEQSLKEIAIPMTFINLGNPGTIPEAVIADRLAALTPYGRYFTVHDADHFSFLPECREGSAELLKSAGEVDPICTETGRPRADIHAELIRLISATLRDTLTKGR